MRVASLLPSATEMVAALGLIDTLVGRSHECDHPPGVERLPVVTASRLDPALGAAAEIDAAVSAAAAAGERLYLVERDTIARLRPDIVVTQGLCRVCAVSEDGITDALPSGATLVSLSGGTLDGVMDDLRTLAAALGVPDRGELVAAQMRQRIDAVRQAVDGARRPRVAVLEWLDPPYAAGHWVPEMVAAAGGVEVMAEPGQHSRRVDWDDVLAAQPEVVIVAPCGYDLAAAAAEATALALDELGGASMVAAVDANAYTSRPGPRLADGVEVLARILQPRSAGAAVPQGSWELIWDV